MYGGRTLLYPDCRRAVELEIGSEVMGALAPLDLLLQSAQWFVHQVAQVLDEELVVLYRRLVAAPGAPLSLSTLWFEALSLLHGTSLATLDRIESDLRGRWAQILRYPLEKPRVAYDASVLRERVEATFGAPDVGWIGARHCSPDVMVAAADVEAIRRGDFELVLGELHLAIIAFGHHCFVTQHPAPEELFHCLDRDVPEPRLLPVLPHEDAMRLTIRTHPALVRDVDMLTALNSSAADPERPRLFASADLVVEELEGSLVVRLPSGETRRLLDLFSVVILRHVMDRFTIFGDDPHTPRITFDRLVVARETWRVPASELEFAREIDEARRHGTVGAVARDRHGNLASATSTGGMTGKLPGRVGDSPIIGAGTYADNATCAVSATGHGEFFIRFGAAHEIAARMWHGGRSLADAARGVVEELGGLGGSGGLVAVGRNGELALPFNCSGMYRGYVETDGIVYTAIYDEAYRSA